MKKIIFLIAFVALTSGCLGSGGAPAGPGSYGLLIKGFSPDLSSVEEGERFSLILEVQNTGGAEATDVYALLHGISVGSGSDNFDIDGDALVEIGDLRGPDEINKIEGDSDILEWRLTAPDVPSGVVIPYDPRVRLMYGYRTSASATVTAISEDEYTRLRKQGESIPISVSGLVSKGPVSVAISSIQSPAVIREGSEDIDLIIEIKKTGDGTIFSPSNKGYQKNGEIDIDDLHLIGVTISAPGVKAESGRCEAFEDESLERMIRGSELRLNCEIKPGFFVGVKEIPVSVELRYNYLIDESTEITVSG